MLFCHVVFFFFKKKTAYEMRISDWSSDVCSSDLVAAADLVVGAVLVAGARAPHVMTREMLKDMEDGSVVVDIAIDQGGCFETSRPTNWKEPTYVEEGVTHFCVTNMPGAVPQTSSQARSEEHTSELQSLMRSPYGVFCLKKKTKLQIK